MPSPTSTPGTLAAANARVPATPAVRALADRLGVALGGVTPTGVGGRITTADVQAASPWDPWAGGSHDGPAAATARPTDTAWDPWDGST